jgi:tetratricopeptide (TPR) repeat protein
MPQPEIEMKPGQRSQWAEVEALVDAVLDRPPAERAVWLADACQDDPELRREAESLLAAAENLDGFLSEPLQLGPEALDEPTLEGRRIGPWKLLHLLGQGGMGSVYLAERADGAFQQRVAVKLIPKALLHSDLRRRFRIERQALGRLVHPNIAGIVDGGVTPEGMPFLVMEHVEGEPIDDYCARRRLGLTERIQLLLGVCEAVRFAHAQLVVHRDLKPANILVIPPGRVKLLDFGIAKLLSDDPETLTRTGLQLFTPQYAAPEQLTGEPVTTATDIYGVGGLAYRLFTGRAPWPTGDASWLRRLRERGRQEPEPPSRTAPHLEDRKRLRGDLDAIVMKALATAPQDRYASIEGLAADLRAYRDNRPIRARPQSTWTRTRKFLRRHRAGAAAALVAVASVAVLLAAFGWQARVAERGRQRAEEVSTFFEELLTSTNPDQARDVELPLADLLEQSVGLAQTKLSNQPELQADILDVLGTSLMRIGHHTDALAVRQKAVELRRGTPSAHSAEMLTGLLSIVDTLSRVNSPTSADRAFRLLEEARGLARDIGGDRGREMARVLFTDGVFRLRHFPPTSAEYQRAEGRLRTARELLEAQRDRSALYADILHSAAAFADSPAEGETLIRQALQVNRELFSDDALQVVSVRNDLALNLDAQGKREEAERLLREVLSVFRRTYGANHPEAVTVENNLAGVLRDQGKFEAAELLYREVLDYRLRFLPPRSPSVAYALYGLGRVMLGQNRVNDAADYLERARDLLEDSHHPLATVADAWLAECRLRQGHRNEAEAMLRRDLEFAEGYWGAESPVTQRIHERLTSLTPSSAASG